MTEKKSFADEVRDHATDDSPHAHQAPAPLIDVMKHFWSGVGRASDTDPEAGFCPESCARRRR